MTDYHLSFKEIPEEVLILVRTTIKLGLFKKENTIDFKMDLLKNLNDKLNTFYHLEPTKLILQAGYYGIGGYSASNKVIILNKPSLVTFLHEFYHHIQHQTNLAIDEDEARGFSHSVYFKATPKLFKNAVEKGLLIFQTSIGEI